MEREASDYYRQRERRERAVARTATDPIAAAIHRDLADRYSRLLGNLAPPPPPRRAVPAIGTATVDEAGRA